MIDRFMVSVPLDGKYVEVKREELRRYFHQSFDLFESLFDLLRSDEVFYRQSEPTRHPMIFYFGHTAIFYINKLVVSGALTQRINPHFEELFAVGVDEMRWDTPSHLLQWPTVNEVRAYRHSVRACVDHLIQTLPLTLPVTQKDPFWAIWMGIEHERIHIETSSVLHRQMPLSHIQSDVRFSTCPSYGEHPTNRLVPFEKTFITLGKGFDDQGLYGWDNEYGEESIEVEPFQASCYLVSNGEFLEFVHEGGYDNPQWWDEEGLRYLSTSHVQCPPFWIPQGKGEFTYRTLTQEIPLPLNWPVEVNALEAEAFCRWKSVQSTTIYQLPSEAQWRVMLAHTKLDTPIFDPIYANINFAHYASSVPVDTFLQGKLYDVVGNVWQWTQTQMAPYKGFFTHPWYEDFTEPTFDGKHNLIKGGSWASTGNEIMRDSRYAFRRHFIQHAGFRYVVGGESEEEKYTRIQAMEKGWKKRYG